MAVRKDVDDRHNVRMTFALTRSDDEIIREAAAKANMDVSAFCRKYIKKQARKVLGIG